LALLADESKRWRPDWFGYSLLGCVMRIDFPIVKLLYFADRIKALESSTNPFALVTAAHLLARQTASNAHRRRIAKWKLTKLLYQRDWSKQRIIDLYRVIDWIMRLPSELDNRLRDGILELERRYAVAYLSSIERIGMEIGMQKGVEQGMQQGMQQGQAELLAALIAHRFGPIDGGIRSKLAAATPEQLTAWARNFVDADTLDDVFNKQ
jgi:hypothetical protein